MSDRLRVLLSDKTRERLLDVQRQRGGTLAAADVALALADEPDPALEGNDAAYGAMMQSFGHDLAELPTLEEPEERDAELDRMLAEAVREVEQDVTPHDEPWTAENEAAWQELAAYGVGVWIVTAAEASAIDRLRAEVDAQRGRISACETALEDRRAALEHAEQGEAEGRRALARQAARGELDGAEHEEAAAELKGAPARAAEAVALASEALDAALEAAREVAAEYEAAVLAAIDGEVEEADGEVATIEQALAGAQARAADARRRREDAAAGLNELRGEFDPGLAKARETRLGQRRELVRSLARQGPTLREAELFRSADPRLRDEVTAEMERLEGERQAERERIAAEAARSRAEVGFVEVP